MADRIDEGWARELRAEQTQAVGPLLNETQTEDLRYLLKSTYGVKPEDQSDVIDTISELAGETGANAKAVVKEALEGYVNPKFLNNESNLQPLVHLVDTAIADRKTRVAEMQSKPSAAAPKPPKMEP